MNPSDCVTDLLAGVNEKRDVTSLSLATHYERSSEWLTEAIQTCKRKILEGTGHDLVEPKRMKKAATTTTVADKENVAVSNVKSERTEKTKRKAIPASSRKAKKADARPTEYLRVMSLKVAELRTELRKRNLDTTGLKKELQNRLLTEMAATQDQPQERIKNESKPTVNDLDGDVQMKDVATTKDSNGESEKMDVDESIVPKLNKLSALKASVKKGATTNENDGVQETTVSKSFFKSTANLFSPTKIASKAHLVKHEDEVVVVDRLSSKNSSSKHEDEVLAVEKPSPDPKQSKRKGTTKQTARNSLTDSLKKTASAILSASPVKKCAHVQATGSAARARPAVKRQEATVEESPHNQSTDATRPESSSALKAQPVNTTSVASLPNKLGSVDKNVGAATKAKRNKCAADRMARLAEIRGKSKPVASSKSSVSKDLPVLSSSKVLQLTKTKDPKSDRKVLLAAQMREKAAGLKTNQLPSKALSASKQSATKQQPRYDESAPSSAVAKAAKTPTGAKKAATGAPTSSTKTTSVLASATKLTTVAVAANAVTTGLHQSQVVPKITASPSLVAQMKQVASASTSKPSTAASSKKKAAARPDVLSPLSTYEMSDREQSDSDESQEEDRHRRQKKKVPTWAQKQNLLPALEAQYANIDGRLDPETIFPAVVTCNLEDIFDQKKSRFNRRTSSANWTKDGVTTHEIVAYKRTMGY